MQLNPYGHELRSALPGFGSDVSSQICSEFERNLLRRARRKIEKRKRGQKRYALDLFSGYLAANGLKLAQMGYTTCAVDFSPPHPSLVGKLKQRFSEGGMLQYWQKDVSKVAFDFLAQQLDIVVCIRGLHFLKYRQARTLLQALSKQLRPKQGEMSFTIGALDCAVGAGYKHASCSVEKRWHPLASVLGEPIHVTEPLCLYSRADIDKLFSGLSGEMRVARDDFGLFLVTFKSD